MADPTTDIKPLAFIGKSEIAKRAETAEARAEAKAEAKREAGEHAEKIMITYGVQGEYPDGTKWVRDATPEEQADIEDMMG